jgi:hypothetical protein
MVNWLQQLTGLSEADARYVWVLLGIVSVALTILGTFTSVLAYRWGKIQGWRDHRNHLDTSSMMEVDLVFREASPDRVDFSVGTRQGVHQLSYVLGDEELEAVARDTVRRGMPGDVLFPQGELRHRGYERVGAHITGNDDVANQAALFGRIDDFHEDITAFMVVKTVAEDGRLMAQTIKVSPRELERILDEDGYVGKLWPFRGAHMPYRDMVQTMAAEYRVSQKLFAAVNAVRETVPEERWRDLEREAGQKASVWLAVIRTHKVGATPDDLRKILREEMPALLAGQRSQVS